MFSHPFKLFFLLLISTTIILCLHKLTWEVLNIQSSHFAKMIEVAQLTPIYIQARIQYLSKQRKWDQIQILSDKVLSLDENYEGSFNFWYKRALSQCSQFKTKQCKQSWLNASLFANQIQKRSIIKMDEIFKFSIAKDYPGSSETIAFQQDAEVI